MSPDLSYLVWAIFAIIVIIFAKPFFWWLFSFEKRVSSLLEQKKSSEVRLGKISETLSPILDDFPVDVHKPGTTTVFLGQPIDFIHFDPEVGIFFIEVKSGEAKLAESQRKIKSLISTGKVHWRDFRVK